MHSKELEKSTKIYMNTLAKLPQMPDYGRAIKQQEAKLVEDINQINKYQAKKDAQPFIHTYQLKKAVKEMQSTTRLTKWVLFFTISACIIGILALLHTYNII